jgi:hypothetical protein
LVILLFLLVAELREVLEKAGCVHRLTKIGFKNTEKNGTIAFLFWFHTIFVGFAFKAKVVEPVETPTNNKPALRQAQGLLAMSLSTKALEK